MDLQTRKIEFVQEFLRVENEEVIAQLEKILKKENDRSAQDTFAPMTIEEFESRIDKSMEDSRNGNLIKATDLQAQVKKWS